MAGPGPACSDGIRGLVARSGRNSRSVMAGHHTGVPAATWSALDLLIFGSGPGCDASSPDSGSGRTDRPARRSGLRSNPSLLRIVRAAVHGRPCATGRSLGRRRHDSDRRHRRRPPQRRWHLRRRGSDADFGFFSMSPASAEQVTIQIRTMMDRSWEYISLAYKGRAFAALGFPILGRLRRRQT